MLFHIEQSHAPADCHCGDCLAAITPVLDSIVP